MGRKGVALCGVVTAALAAVGYSQYWVATGRFATVERGRLYRSAALPADRLVQLAKRYRITTVVDFREEADDTQAEAAALARAGLRHVAIPSDQVPSAASVARFLEVMDASRNEAVLIHCEHGVGRTGVFAAVYRMEYQGWSHRAAVAEALVYAGLGSFGPANPKTRFLMAYVPGGRHPR